MSEICFWTSIYPLTSSVGFVSSVVIRQIALLTLLCRIVPLQPGLISPVVAAETHVALVLPAAVVSALVLSSSWVADVTSLSLMLTQVVPLLFGPQASSVAAMVACSSTTVVVHIVDVDCSNLGRLVCYTIFHRNSSYCICLVC